MMLARRGGLTRILAQKFITMKFLLNCEGLGVPTDILKCDFGWSMECHYQAMRITIRLYISDSYVPLTILIFWFCYCGGWVQEESLYECMIVGTWLTLAHLRGNYLTTSLNLSSPEHILAWHSASCRAAAASMWLLTTFTYMLYLCAWVHELQWVVLIGVANKMRCLWSSWILPRDLMISTDLLCPQIFWLGGGRPGDSCKCFPIPTPNTMQNDHKKWEN